MNTDADFLRVAIALAGKHMEAGDGGPFGAVIVHEGQIVAEGWNQVTSALDPTAHAEIVAIRKAAGTLARFALSGGTLYTSCEPCPMCLAAAYWARLDRIVYAATREDAASIGFDDARLYAELALPVDQRQIPMLQALRDEALMVFQAWTRKEGRIAY